MEKKALVGPIADVALAGLPSAIGYRMGAKKGLSMAEKNEPLDKRSLLASLLIPGAIGYRSGKEQGHEMQSYVNRVNDALAAAGHPGRANVKLAAIDLISLQAMSDEVEQMKAAGVLDRLMTGIGNVTRGGSFVGGGGGGTPSAGFQAFQQQRAGAAAPNVKVTLPQAQPAAPRALPPMNQPLNPGGMNVMFSPKQPQMPMVSR